MRLGSTSMYVDVSIDDILDDVSVADLVKYLTDKRDLDDASKSALKADDSFLAMIKEAYERLVDGDAAMCQLVLEQALFPKFKTVGDCLMKMKLKAA